MSQHNAVEECKNPRTCKYVRMIQVFLPLALQGNIPMSNNAELRPHKALLRLFWLRRKCSPVHGTGALWRWEKKCACHLIGTQATDIVSRDEQSTHTSLAHYLHLLHLHLVHLYHLHHLHLHHLFFLHQHLILLHLLEYLLKLEAESC